MYPCRILGNGPHTSSNYSTVIITFLRNELISSHNQKRLLFEVYRSSHNIYDIPESMADLVRLCVS